MRNLQTNPRIEVNFVDPFVRKGYRFAGTAKVLPRGEGNFDELLKKSGSSLAPRVRARARPSRVFLARGRGRAFEQHPFLKVPLVRGVAGGGRQHGVRALRG